MSGQNSCAAVAAQSEINRNRREFINTVNAIATFGISKFFEKDPPKEPTVNIINNNYQEIKRKFSENRCANISNVKQYNIFEQPTECYDAINKVCINNKTGVPDTNCLDLAYEILDESSSKPITQSNINKITSICEINSALQVLSEKDQTEENLNTIKLLQDARAKASDKQSEGLNCNEINTNITREKYINSFLKCANKTTVNQENLLSSCTPNISLQINENNQMNKCLMDSGIMGGVKETISSSTTPIILYTTPIPTIKPITTPPQTTILNNTEITTTPIIEKKGLPMIIIIVVVGVVLLIIVLLLLFL